MANQNPSASDLILAIQLLADSKQAVKEVQILEKELDKLGVTINKTKSNLSTLGKGDADLNKTSQSVKNLNQSLTQTPQATKRAGEGLFNLRNIARTALGTFEAMAIFFLTQFVGNALKKVIDSLTQVELAMYKIGIAEKTLSKAGVDILPQDLVDIAKQVSDTYTFVSNIDAQKMISNLAILTKDLKLTKDQYSELANAIPILATQADVSIESATDQIVTGLTKSGRGWADLGIQVNSAIIKEKAIALQLVETADAYDKLTAEQKQQVEVLSLIAILNDSVSDAQESQSEFVDTTAEKIKNLNAEWEDFTAIAGTTFSPAIKGGLDILLAFVKELRREIEVSRALYIEFFAVVLGGYTAMKGLLKGNVSSFQEFRALVQQSAQEARDLMSEFLTPQAPADTPTAIVPEISGTLEGQEDLQKALERMNDEILESQIRLAQDMEEAQIDLGRKLVDIAREYAKKRADAEREYGNKVRDINSEYREEVADINAQQAEANQQARNDELQREAEFQNKMQELKENFLMDLEEALHERDARAVLRLTKQYNLDKLQAERSRALEREESAREQGERNRRFARERADAERERRAKLNEAKIQLQDKLAQLKADEEAERQSAELAYQRKLQDLEREMHDRLEILGATLIREFNLTKTGLNAILTLYQKYYSNIAQIYQAMNKMLQNTPVPSPVRTNPYQGGDYTNPGVIGGHVRFAEGGTMVADRPTTVTFGEHGLEEATFTPLGRTGKNVNKLFSNLSGDGQSGGNVQVEILLGSDLEGRIVSNTLNKTAEIVQRVHRSK